MTSKGIQHPERLIDVALLREKLNGLVPASGPEASRIRPAVVDMLKEFLKSAGWKQKSDSWRMARARNAQKPCLCAG